MKKAFTLVELVVILGIFAIFLLAGADFLIQTIRNSNRSAMENEVRQNANLIMQDIVSEARKADPAIASVITAGSLTITTANAVPSRQVKYSTDVNGILSKILIIGGVEGTPAVLSSNRVAALNCTGCPSTGCSSGLVASQTSVSDPLVVNLTVQNSVTYLRSDFCAKVSLSQNITARQY